ncbi:MAG: hypothetical protein WBX25_21295 [Rhodomicrobium sp.]
MGLDPKLDIVERALHGFVNQLVCRGEGYLPKAQAITFFETILPCNGNLNRSLLSQLESEGLLAVEPVRQYDGCVEAMVRFTFERFSDHAIAARLLDDHLSKEDIEGSFKAGERLGELVFGEESHRYAGIIEAIAIQLPERTGHEILELRGTSSWIVRDAFFESFLWRDQKCFSDRTFELLEVHGDSHSVNKVLISIATEPANKFNAKCIHQNLIGMVMPERDRVWSAYVARSGEDEGGPIETLINWALLNGLENIEDERAELAALTLAWLLSTSNRAVRDKATKSLAALFANRLQLAASVLHQFAKTDDLYVLERLFAAAYGAALQGTATSGLANLAETTFSLVFASGIPP